MGRGTIIKVLRMVNKHAWVDTGNPRAVGADGEIQGSKSKAKQES